MRPPLDTGEIGDGISLALHDGVIGEIGSVRKYDPINPFDVSEGDDETIRPALFPTSNAIPFKVALSSTYLQPMTFHQRLYQWPAVGPMPYDAERSVSQPPVEVPQGQSEWALRPITSIPINRVNDETTPLMGEQPLDTEAIIPQRGNRRRDAWTVRKTMPWATTVFIRNVQLEGESGRWLIEGVTRDSTGTALGSCRVVAMRSDKIAINQDIQANPVVADLTSDGSGNFSAQVGANVPHQLTAYKAGSPDVAGVTVNNVMPVAK